MADALTVRNKRTVQLNEKVSETLFDILYPETTAEQVITNDNRMFVTKAQIEAWTKGEGSMHFKNEWTANTAYDAGDIVYCYDTVNTSIVHYYICNVEHTSTSSSRPTHEKIATNIGTTIYWFNMDYTAYLAEESDTVKTKSATTNKTFYLAFVNDNNTTTNGEYEAVYTNSGISYNPSTGTLTVANINGKASSAAEADHAVDADHADAADEATHATSADSATTATNYVNTADTDDGVTNIQETFESINSRIDDIVDGKEGAVLGHSVNVQKNGNNVSEKTFNGSEDVTFNITISPYDIVAPDATHKALIDTTTDRIDASWLPSSVLGNMRYGGTFDKDGVITSSDTTFNGQDLDNLSASDFEGVYFLAAISDQLGHTIAGVADVRVGDWIVSNGSAGWAKIDNTDAVTMVNSQIGAVEIYKGDWATATQYYKGDIIKYNGALYIANDTVKGDSFDATKFDIFGHVYDASDGIKLDGLTFKHDVTIQSGTTSNTDVDYGGTIQVPVLTRDDYGHVTKIDLTNYTLPAKVQDTWRDVAVNGTTVLDKSITGKALNIANGNLITVTYASDILTINHNTSGYDASSYAAEKLTATQTNEVAISMGDAFTVPIFSWDAYGHILNVQKGVYRLPSSNVAHRHFDIAVANGVSTIQAFGSTTATASWLATAANAGKFYEGNVVPTGDYTLNFNGDFVAKTLYQIENGVKKKVLDSAIGLYGGTKVDGTTAITGSYDTDNNRIEMGDSGVVAGVYSAVAVNSKGLVTSGGEIIEFGQVVDADPSASLAVGGLFFRLLGSESATEETTGE